MTRVRSRVLWESYKGIEGGWERLYHPLPYIRPGVRTHKRRHTVPVDLQKSAGREPAFGELRTPQQGSPSLGLIFQPDCHRGAHSKH